MRSSRCENQHKAHWATIRPILTIRNEQECEQAIKRLNALLDEIGPNERHPWHGFAGGLYLTLPQGRQQRRQGIPTRDWSRLRFALSFTLLRLTLTRQLMREPSGPA